MALYADVLVDVPLKQSFTYLVPEGLQEASLFGCRAVVPFGSREVTGYIVGVRDTDDSPFELKELKRMIDSEPVFTEKTVELVRWISRFYLCSEGEAISLVIPGGRRDSAYGGLEQDEAFSAGRIERLSAEQEAALSSILNSDERMFYLHGVTGSGKSEVYLRTAEAVIAEGKGVIYLVPEITLTHQLAALVAGRFSNRVAILHSALTPSQRLKQWRRILNGEVDLVIGARSAVFAPVENLGLIIIDEEHENSYKSGSTPRYHARQVAQHRVRKEGARLIMGSATPSLEAYHLMHKTEAITPLFLTKRVAGGAMPKIEVVNLLGEKRTISAHLARLMKETLAAKKQVILFLNRRGFSYFFHCRSCGFELRCPHCDVSLTYHKHKGRLVCHYCGYARNPITSCPSCHSLDVGYSGYGTEMVEEEVKSLFPSPASSGWIPTPPKRKAIFRRCWSASGTARRTSFWERRWSPRVELPPRRTGRHRSGGQRDAHSRFQGAGADLQPARPGLRSGGAVYRQRQGGHSDVPSGQPGDRACPQRGSRLIL